MVLIIHLIHFISKTLCLQEMDQLAAMEYTTQRL